MLKFLPLLAIGFILTFTTYVAEVTAASLLVSPSTGVYPTGSTFSARVVVNTSGSSINAAEGTLKFNPQELAVVAIDRQSSIFNLWVTEPEFSNSAGTVTFSGGLPSGYTGSAGTVFTVTFRVIASGTVRLSYLDGVVLANDGKGTNILSGMSGGTYTIEAPSSSPAPEIIEYVAPANTPGAPVVRSSTHEDPLAWYNKNEAVLSWEVPNGVTAIRTLVDRRSSSVPTKLYETPISTITISDLSEGENYFHIQFKNAEGWGRVAHYRLAVDTEDPFDFSITAATSSNQASAKQILVLNSQDATSEVKRFIIRINNNEPYEYVSDEKETVELPILSPGYHTVLIEAFDEAGNSTMASYSFTIEAFEAPYFTEYPESLTVDVIPVLRGQTKPSALVQISVEKIGAEPIMYEVLADDIGVFTFIPEGKFQEGVYELSAIATDAEGAVSLQSQKIRIAVQPPGYIQIGERLISILSIVVTVAALLVSLVLLVWLLVVYSRKFKRLVFKESKEALEVVQREFSILIQKMEEGKELIREDNKTKKLSKIETEAFANFETALTLSKNKIMKEIEDVEELAEKKG